MTTKSDRSLSLVGREVFVALFAWIELACSAAALVQSPEVLSSSGRRAWSVEELTQGGGELVGCIGTSIRFRVLNSRASTPVHREESTEARGLGELPSWLTLGEPFVIGDRRYPRDLSQALLVVRSGARLRLNGFRIGSSKKLTAEDEAPDVQLDVELRVLSPVGGVSDVRRFGPDFVVRANAAARLVSGRDLSRVEVAAHLRLLELADGLDEFGACSEEKAARCTNSALAEALATVVLGRGAGIRPQAQALRRESLDAARRRFAAEPCKHAAAGSLSAPTPQTLVCLLRCVALADSHQLLATPQTIAELRRHAAAVQLELDALTPHDDPLLVEWALRLARATHNEHASVPSPFDGWTNYLREQLELVVARSGGAQPLTLDVWTVPCPSEDSAAPADRALELWAELATSAQPRAQRTLALEDCAECARALDSYRATMLELTAAHAQGVAEWERVQRELVLPAVVLTESGLDDRSRPGACRNAQVIEAATRASVLTARWSMGHSYASGAR